MSEIYHRTLKPDIPWEARRYIRQKEREADRLEAWQYRIEIAIELVAIVILSVVLIHFHITA